MRRHRISVHFLDFPVTGPVKSAGRENLPRGGGGFKMWSFYLFTGLQLAPEVFEFDQNNGEGRYGDVCVQIGAKLIFKL